jgi:hypothetical protein
MATSQGDLTLLNDPVAQRLLQAPIPAQLAYTWTDGTPRVVPIWFHWDGSQFILAGPPSAPKMRVLADGAKVALTINTSEFPYKALYVRGTVSITRGDQLTPEYALAAKRMLGDEGSASWLEQVKLMLPAMGGMTRVALTPEWVAIIDFEQRFPSAIEQAIATASAGAA